MHKNKSAQTNNCADFSACNHPSYGIGISLFLIPFIVIRLLNTLENDLPVVHAICQVWLNEKPKLKVIDRAAPVKVSFIIFCGSTSKTPST